MLDNSEKIGTYNVFSEFILRTPMLPYNYFKDSENDITSLLNRVC